MIHSIPSKILASIPIFFCSLGTFAADTTGWKEIPLAGDTKCADGSPYKIFINKGTTSRVVFDFLAGGACWSAETCQEGFDGFTAKVPDILGKVLPNYGGIYDRQNSLNPFKQDTHIIIPYCTGDVHWGARDTTYSRSVAGPQTTPRQASDSVTIYHRGAINAKTAIDYALSQIDIEPRDIFVTGCSAGSYGSIWWTPYIKKQWPRAKVVQFGDSGAGVVTDTFRTHGFANWNISTYAPTWVPGLNIPPDQMSMTKIYTAIGQYDPAITTSQFNYNSDIVQRWFYMGMGGDPAKWTSNMRLSMFEISNASPRYSYYIQEGSGHCILPDDALYDPRNSGPLGQPIYDWLSAIARGHSPEHEPCIGCAEDASQSLRNPLR